MFTDLFGGAPHARVLDYLVEERDQDHTITGIARGADVARPTVYKVLDDFHDQGVIVKTRTVGNSRFFQLDLEDPTVQDLLRVAEVEPVEEPEEGFATFDLAGPPGPDRDQRRGRNRRKR